MNCDCILRRLSQSDGVSCRGCFGIQRTGLTGQEYGYLMRTSLVDSFESIG